MVPGQITSGLKSWCVNRGYWRLTIVSAGKNSVFLAKAATNLKRAALTYQLEVEFEISDLNGDRVWKKTYYDSKKI